LEAVENSYDGVTGLKKFDLWDGEAHGEYYWNGQDLAMNWAQNVNENCPVIVDGDTVAMLGYVGGSPRGPILDQATFARYGDWNIGAAIVAVFGWHMIAATKVHNPRWCEENRCKVQPGKN